MPEKITGFDSWFQIADVQYEFRFVRHYENSTIIFSSVEEVFLKYGPEDSVTPLPCQSAATVPL